MPLRQPDPGLVISYSYLWTEERRRGASEGRKNRPCAIVLATKDEDRGTVVYVLPVTHAPPGSDEDAVEMPMAAKRRLGLDGARSWIITSELNRFVWPGFDLRPISRDRPDVFAYGFLPVETFAAVKAAVARAGRARRLDVVGRE